MEPGTREKTPELRAVAPLVVVGPQLKLVGPCTLVTNGRQTIAFSSADLLRGAGDTLAIAITLDCKRTIRVSSWSLGRVPHMGIIELAARLPTDGPIDVAPLPIGSLSATADTRGAPAALVTVRPGKAGVARRLIPVHVDVVDDGGMTDLVTRLASPDEAADHDVDADGAVLFAWMPADPLLARPSEVVAVALATSHRQRAAKPRALPPIAELFGLEDIGRALPWEADAPEVSNELGQVAGEIRAETGPLDLAARAGAADLDHE